jgi:hypothetical protein
LHKKAKGSIAELAVASKLMNMGWRVLFPFGENSRYDLVAEKEGKFVKVQVKYITPKNGTLEVNCKSSNNWSVDKYTPKQVDFIAAYNAVHKKIYFLPSSKFNSSSIKLRFEPAKNGQQVNIKNAGEFLRFK